MIDKCLALTRDGKQNEWCFFHLHVSGLVRELVYCVYLCAIFFHFQMRALLTGDYLNRWEWFQLKMKIYFIRNWPWAPFSRLPPIELQISRDLSAVRVWFVFSHSICNQDCFIDLHWAWMVICITCPIIFEIELQWMNEWTCTRRILHCAYHFRGTNLFILLPLHTHFVFVYAELLLSQILMHSK